MFCTDKERMTCQVEKMGCEGCYYNNDKNNSFVNKLIEKFQGFFKRKSIKIPQFRYCIETSRIKIPDSFWENPPRKSKMIQRARYFCENGKFFVPIVINRDGLLIDGFTSYIIAIAESMKWVDVEVKGDEKNV